jgi:dihydroorotate dehydrogenase
MPPPSLRTRIAGLDLSHPVGLAAGFDKNAERVPELFAHGFAMVEVGTVTPRPQAGNPRPRLFRLREDRALINRMGFNNEGMEAMARRLAGCRRPAGVLGINIGMNRDAEDPVADYRAVLERVYPFADYLTINVSSPNTPGLRGLQRADRLQPLLSVLLERREGLVAGGAGRRPIFLKIAPDLDEDGVEAIASVMRALDLDGLIVANTTLARPADLRSTHAGEVGGLSGRPLFTRSTRLLARFAEALGPDLPLIAVGGIEGPATALAKIEAGASALQLYTGLIYRGIGLIDDILAGLAGALEAQGLHTLDEMRGRSVAELAALPLDQPAQLA